MDKAYPFEFTVDLPNGENRIEIQLDAIKKDGKKIKSSTLKLGS